MRDIHTEASTISTSCDSTKLKLLKELKNKVSELDTDSATTPTRKPGNKLGKNYEGLDLPEPLKYHRSRNEDDECAKKAPEYFSHERLLEYKDVGKKLSDKVNQDIARINNSLKNQDALNEFCDNCNNIFNEKLKVTDTNAYKDLCAGAVGPTGMPGAINLTDLDE